MISINQITRHLKFQLMKRKGTKTNRHIVVLESDDWGSVRMPSKKTFERLNKKEIRMCAPFSYDRFDTLETEKDLTCLMEVLDTVRDKNGCPAVITMNYVMGNPNFDRIENDEYKKYSLELFPETYKHFPQCTKSYEYLKEGMRKKMFRPQFHGREHLNVQRWMRNLQEGDMATVAAFKERCFSVMGGNSVNTSYIMAAFDSEFEEDNVFIRQSIAEGLDLFEEVFGYTSKTMIAPCYTWDPYVEEVAHSHGVKIMQGGAIQRYSYYHKQTTGEKTHLRYNGEHNQYGQIYTIRNCSFEPSERPSHGMERCLRDIESQFSLHHPVIISCHRQNFIGELEHQNRDSNLKALKTILKTIVKNYPDVEFLSSDELIGILY